MPMLYKGPIIVTIIMLTFFQESLPRCNKKPVTFVTFVCSLCQLGHQQLAGHLTGWTPVAYRVAVGGYISYSRGKVLDPLSQEHV